MSPDTALSKWASTERKAWSWIETLKKDSEKIGLVRERKLLLNMFTNVFGLDEDHAELFLAGSSNIKRGLHGEYKKTVKKVLDWLDKSEPYGRSKGYKKASTRFFEGFAKAVEGLYTPEQVKEIRQMYTPGGEVDLTTTLTGERGFKYVHRATLRSLL